MAKRKFKINLFDAFILAIVILFGLIGVFSYQNKPNLGSENVLIDVVVSDTETIKNMSDKIKNNGEVFFSGTKYPVMQVNKIMQYSVNGETKMYLTLKGPGKIAENNSIFNGQRVFINQKVEVRSDYYVQGRVVKIYYEN